MKSRPNASVTTDLRLVRSTSLSPPLPMICNSSPSLLNTCTSVAYDDHPACPHSYTQRIPKLPRPLAHRPHKVPPPVEYQYSIIAQVLNSDAAVRQNTHNPKHLHILSLTVAYVLLLSPGTGTLPPTSLGSGRPPGAGPRRVLPRHPAPRRHIPPSNVPRAWRPGPHSL